ncbi:hypothetical protein [Streptomyces sp. NPDC058295]|uniref:hypothetical protein n=1 Tax=Streptomyces sp. NPDC058295 TaxID=3346431 RepID=UPI0036E54176
MAVETTDNWPDCAAGSVSAISPSAMSVILAQQGRAEQLFDVVVDLACTVTTRTPATMRCTAENRSGWSAFSMSLTGSSTALGARPSSRSWCQIGELVPQYVGSEVEVGCLGLSQQGHTMHTDCVADQQLPPRGLYLPLDDPQERSRAAGVDADVQLFLERITLNRFARIESSAAPPHGRGGVLAQVHGQPAGQFFPGPVRSKAQRALGFPDDPNNGAWFLRLRWHAFVNVELAVSVLEADDDLGLGTGTVRDRSPRGC